MPTHALPNDSIKMARIANAKFTFVYCGALAQVLPDYKIQFSVKVCNRKLLDSLIMVQPMENRHVLCLWSMAMANQSIEIIPMFAKQISSVLHNPAMWHFLPRYKRFVLLICQVRDLYWAT